MSACVAEPSDVATAAWTAMVMSFCHGMCPPQNAT
jgi:hypothetical protein